MSVLRNYFKHLWLQFTIVLICLYSIQAFEYFTEQPSFLPPCKIYERGFTKCSTHSVGKLLEQMGIGIPEITELVGSLDPMKINEIIFKQDNNEAATIRATLTDLIVKGLSKIIVKESRVSKKDFSWETKLLLPSMRLEGKYAMEGRILLIPLKGNGDFFIEMENLDILMHTKTRLHEKGNFTFYDVKQIRVDVEIKRLKTNFENLFNGRNKEIERSTNEFFNENWRDFYEALRPLITETVENILLKLLKPTFDIIPANFFVEDIPTSKQLYDKKN